MNSSMMLIETTYCILGSGKKNKRKDATAHSETESAHPKKMNKLTSPSAQSEEADVDDISSVSSDSDDGKEQEKVLKQLNFPDVESGSFNPNMCPKVMKCLSKRLSKLETHEASFPEESKRSDIQSQSESQNLKGVSFLSCVASFSPHFIVSCLFKGFSPAPSKIHSLQGC